MVSKLELMILMLLGVVGTVLGACPEPNDISPCSCKANPKDLELLCHDEDVTLDDLKKILGAFNTTDTLDLDFYYINLGTVPTDYFKGFNIRIITFSHCKFEPIPDKEGRILVGLEDTLEEFSVINTIEEHNSPDVLDLSHLNKLDTMFLTHNAIPRLSDNWFKKGPSSLTYLTIVGNKIGHLGDNAFANLPNLKYLNLEDNQFGRMKRSFLPNPATHLTTLYLNENGFEALPEDFFTGMPALSRLTLDADHLLDIPQGTFGRIWDQLDYISIEDNSLNCENSTLKWIVDSKHTPKLFGRCATPPERENRRILEVIKELRGDDD